MRGAPGPAVQEQRGKGTNRDELDHDSALRRKLESGKCAEVDILQPVQKGDNVAKGEVRSDGVDVGYRQSRGAEFPSDLLVGTREGGSETEVLSVEVSGELGPAGGGEDGFVDEVAQLWRDVKQKGAPYWADFPSCGGGIWGGSGWRAW